MGIKNTTFRDNDIGVSIPKGSERDLEIEDSEFIRNRIGYEVRDEADVRNALGLPADIPTEDVRRLLTLAQTAASPDKEAVAAAIGPWEWLGNVSNTAALVDTLAGWVSSDFVTEALKLL